MSSSSPSSSSSSNWSVTLASSGNSALTRTGVADPFGFNATAYEISKSSSSSKRADRTVTAEDNQADLKVKKAWEMATATAKSLPMNAFMLYMSGSGVQIFSIMMTAMQLWNGFQGLVNTDKAFERFVIAPGPTNVASLLNRSNPNSPLLLSKLVYILMQFLVAGLGLYKMSQMGLLPTAKSDWLAWETPQTWSEWSGGTPTM